MDIAYRPESEAFREEIRAFCRDEVPEEFKRAVRHEGEIEGEDSRHWLRVLYRKGGWSAPGWSREMGGPGWSDEQQYVFERELALNDAPRVPLFGAGMIGPAIIEFGTREMQEQFLPAILKGEILWCQGYSEPNSGSDLASLQTSAERDGDHYILNGTKMWTSDGHHADWMFGLFRTDNSGKKQHGITVLLVDMKTPGIELRPILTFDGGHETNQTFFDDVRVPVANRLGDEHQGWTVAKYILGLERFGTAEVSRSQASLERLKRIARDESSPGDRLIDEEDFADAIAQVELELRALELTEQRFLFGPGGAGRDGSRGLDAQDPRHRGAAAHYGADGGGARLLRSALRARAALGGLQRGTGGTDPDRLRGAQLLQHAQDLHLLRIQRDPEEHHRQGGAGTLMKWTFP